MKWIDPEYSKNMVGRAGKNLIDPICTETEYDISMEILSNWRASHAYPMHAMLISLRRRSSKIDVSSVVVQRLKRTPSILTKLERFPDMKLNRMQDIGGCRSVVKTTKQAENLNLDIQNSRTRHILHKVDDYITEPKPSGYRGIHLVYKYRGEKEQYRDFFVELQIRSKIQHAWATAVEIVDTFTKQALKASHGQKDWMDFFRYTSAEFALMEDRPIGDYVSNINTKSEVVRLERNLNALNRLNAFAVTTQHIAKKKANKSDYFLLRLEGEPQVIKITAYPASLIQSATQKYLEFEKRALKEALFDVVLVSAGSLHALKAAYPNYFADSREFIKYLKRILTI